MATDIRAELNNCGVSAQKVRLVVNLVRGKPAVQALNTLQFTPKVAAHHVRKLLASAVANAEENFGVSREDLVVYSIAADEAPTRKWRRFGARGRFKPLLRRSSHITVYVSASSQSANQPVEKAPPLAGAA
jgi:large subunit ribosomal protein L22